MTEEQQATVCIVGAGSAGIITGYMLNQGGTAITYLVRPHRAEQLSRPQKLYSYDDGALKSFGDYAVITDPVELNGRSFDFIFVTLDGAALRTEAGMQLTDDIGRMARDTGAGIILAAQGLDLRSWFLNRSGLPENQVALGGIASFVYEVPAATLPAHEGTDVEALSKADYAYRHFTPAGFAVETSAPAVASGFATLYNRNGSLVCNTVSTADYILPGSMLCPVFALALLGWPAARDVDASDEAWRLGVEASREMLRLSLYGEAGKVAAEHSGAETMLAVFQQVEQATLPLDWVGFLRYLHGNKLKAQNKRTIRDALAMGKAEGLEMPAMQQLMDRISEI